MQWIICIPGFFLVVAGYFLADAEEPQLVLLIFLVNEGPGPSAFEWEVLLDQLGFCSFF